MKGAGVWKRCLEKIIEVLTVWVPETLNVDINVGAQSSEWGSWALGPRVTNLEGTNVEPSRRQ